MGLLAQFFERLYGPGPTFTTVQATVGHWKRLDLARKAEAAPADLKPIGRRKLSGSAGSPEVEESTLSIWLALPSRGRIEVRPEKGPPPRKTLTVANESGWWERGRDACLRVGSSESGPFLTEADRHFDQDRMRHDIVDLAVEEVGPVPMAGRDCVRARGTKRPGESGIWPHWLPFGADECDLYLDPERAVLLAVTGLVHGEPFQSDVVEHVAFDEAIDPALFTVPEEDVSGVEPPISERLSLEQAIRRAPFTVLVPTRLPDSDHMHLEPTYHPARPWGDLEHLVLFYMGGRTQPSLWIREAAAADPESGRYEWEPVEHTGRRMLISDPGVPGCHRLLALEQDGTHVTITSDLDRGQLLDLATSLKPARPGPHQHGSSA